MSSETGFFQSKFKNNMLIILPLTHLASHVPYKFFEHPSYPIFNPLCKANIANDPEAAARVFAAGFNTHVAGLDVTMATWCGTPRGT